MDHFPFFEEPFAKDINCSFDPNILLNFLVQLFFKLINVCIPHFSPYILAFFVYFVNEFLGID